MAAGGQAHRGSISTLLGGKDFAALVRQTQLTEHELSQVVALIKNPTTSTRRGVTAESSRLRSP